jgi:hypothetical protein
MSFCVTDPSVAPANVVEVQLYRPHKDSLPVVKVGDVVLLQRFVVVALTKRGFGVRTAGDSAWGVWEASGERVYGDGNGDAPQIRGPPVEGWEGCVGCVGVLRRWFGGLDEVARGKIERAGRKMVEPAGGK